MSDSRLVFLTVDKHQLGLLQRDESGLHLITTRVLEEENFLTPEFRALLGSEGDRLCVSRLNTNSDPLEDGVDAISLEDLSTVAQYKTPQAMTSMTSPSAQLAQSLLRSLACTHQVGLGRFCCAKLAQL